MTQPPDHPDDRPGGTPPPAYSGSDDEAPARTPVGPRPSSVALAVKLMYVAAAVAALTALSTLFQQDSLREAAEQQDLGGVSVDDAVAFIVVGAVVSGLIGAALWAVFALLIGKGLNWARITGVVLGGINVLAQVNSLRTSGQPVTSILLTLVTLALAIAVIVLLFRPDSNAFFAKKPVTH